MNIKVFRLVIWNGGKNSAAQAVTFLNAPNVAEKHYIGYAGNS